jgi:hypothetical protein
MYLGFLLSIRWKRITPIKNRYFYEPLTAIKKAEIRKSNSEQIRKIDKNIIFKDEVEFLIKYKSYKPDVVAGEN